MAEPKIDQTSGVEYGGNLLPKYNKAAAAEEEPSIFSEDDKLLTREVNGEDREIRIGRKDGHKYRYTDDTHEELVAVTTEGKNTYLTKAEFDRQVKEMLHVDELPVGIKAEYRDGSIVFVDAETNLTLSATQLREDERILAAQNKKAIQPIKASDLLKDALPLASINPEPTFTPISVKMPTMADGFNREKVLDTIKENPNDFLPLLAQVYGDTRKGQSELLQLVKKNFDISLPSGASVEDINKRLAEVKSPMRGMGQLFLDAEAKYGVNAWAVLSVIGIESSYGKNKAQGTSGNFIGLKHRNSNQHRELLGNTREATYRNNINAAAHQLHLYNTRGLTSPSQVAARYCDRNKGPWSNFMATEILRGQGIRGAKPDENLVAQLRGETPQTKPTPELAALTPQETPAVEPQEDYNVNLQEVVITGSLSKVKKQTPLSQVSQNNGNGTET